MTDAHIAMQAQHVPGMEHITHQAVVLAQVQSLTVAGDDACSILPAVLQYGQAVIQRLVDRTAGNDADNAAHMLDRQ